MITISARQVHAITEPPLVVQIAEQLARYFHARCRYLGEMRLHDVVRAYLQIARRHGMVSERELAVCVHLLFMFGHDMHRDPQLPWVAELLAGPGTAWQRIVAVRTRAMAHLDRIHGPDNAALVRASARLRRLTPAELAQQVDVANELGTMFGLLRRLHPEKFAALGEALLDDLWAENRAQTRRLGLGVRESQVWMILQFTLGVGVGRDPQHPWLAVALARKRRGELLHEYTVGYLEQLHRTDL